jgi:Ras-related protein Rab-19
MLKKLESGIFDPETKLTVGIDFFVKEYHQFFEHKVIAQIWDLVGAERFDFIRPFAYKGANCLILVIDLTRPNTLENIDYFTKIADQAGIKPDQIILVGTKLDLFYLRSIDSSYLASFLDKYRFAELIETSARNSHNLDVLFELATCLAMAQKGLMTMEEFSSIKQDLKKRIKEPVIEPYEKLVRKCWNCNKALYFYEFCDSNTETAEKELSEWWESPYLQFLCCDCYKKFDNICDSSPS